MKNQQPRVGLPSLPHLLRCIFLILLLFTNYKSSSESVFSFISLHSSVSFITMSSNSYGGWLWGSLRPWQILHSRLAESDVRGSPLEIWSLLDETMGGAPFGGFRNIESAFSHMRFFLEDDEEFWRPGGIMEERIRDWVSSRSLELDEINPRPIDTTAVFSKCHKEVHKRKSCVGSAANGKTLSEQEDCPVCLEKFVQGQTLLSLPCNHKFHKECLTPWIQGDHRCCPCCRADIVTSSSEILESSSDILASSSTATVSLAATVRSVAENTSSTTYAVSSSGSNSGSGSTNSNSNGTARSVRHEDGDDIMSVLAAMEEALEALGFRS